MTAKGISLDLWTKIESCAICELESLQDGWFWMLVFVGFWGDFRGGERESMIITKQSSTIS